MIPIHLEVNDSCLKMQSNYFFYFFSFSLETFKICVDTFFTHYHQKHELWLKGFLGWQLELILHCLNFIFHRLIKGLCQSNGYSCSQILNSTICSFVLKLSYLFSSFELHHHCNTLWMLEYQCCQEYSNNWTLNRTYIFINLKVRIIRE